MEAISTPHWARYLPEGILSSDVSIAIGIISDTHAPQRYPDVPEPVFDIFKDVNLILHAGDVGKLWVLDKLGSIAPVVAVHGNDETQESTRELPYQQVVMVAGRRILMWHNHFPDRAEEMAFRRQDDTWERILDRHVTQAAGSNASIIVYGHTHIPMALTYKNKLMINPGAIAGGNLWMRQTASVALLFLLNDGSNLVSHIMLDELDRRFEPQIVIENGFKASLYRFQEEFIDPIPHMPRYSQIKDIAALEIMWREIAGPYLWGTQIGKVMRLEEWIDAVKKTKGIHPEDKSLILNELQTQLSSM